MARSALTRRPPGARMASVIDVAREAGVSTATVSRALSGAAAVSDATRRRVDAACQALGYIPHGPARALASRRTRTLGVVVPSIENDGFARTVFAIQQTVKPLGWSLLLGGSDYDPETELEAVTRLISHGVEGLVLIGGERHPLLRSRIERRRTPLVEAWTLAAGAVSVGFDNTRAAGLIADHLLALGHRRIAVATGQLEHNDRAAARVAGVAASMAGAGLPPPVQWRTTQPYRIAEGRRAASEILSNAAPPTALVCGNDQLAFGVLAQARVMGIAVPADLSVTGFGDSDYAQFLDPPLTTVHVPAELIGARAADYLMRTIAGEAPPAPRSVEVELVVRASTGAPRPGA